MSQQTQAGRNENKINKTKRKREDMQMYIVDKKKETQKLWFKNCMPAKLPQIFRHFLQSIKKGIMFLLLHEYIIENHTQIIENHTQSKVGFNLVK